MGFGSALVLGEWCSEKVECERARCWRACDRERGSPWRRFFVIQEAALFWQRLVTMTMTTRTIWLGLTRIAADEVASEVATTGLVAIEVDLIVDSKAEVLETAKKRLK